MSEAFVLSFGQDYHQSSSYSLSVKKAQVKHHVFVMASLIDTARNFLVSIKFDIKQYLDHLPFQVDKTAGVGQLCCIKRQKDDLI